MSPKTHAQFLIIVSSLTLALAARQPVAQVVFNPRIDQMHGINFDDTPVGEESVFNFTAENRANQQASVRILQIQAPFSAQPPNANIPAGGIQQFTLTFAPEDEGDFANQIFITVAQGMLIRRYGPIRLAGTGVGGEPDINVTPDEIDILLNREHERDEARITIENVGESALEYSISAVENDWLDFDGDEAVLEPDDMMMYGFEFSTDWLEDDEYEDEFLIESNDPDEPEIRIPVHVLVDLPVIVEQVIELQAGWSWISSQVDFTDDVIDEEGPDMRLILDGILDHLSIIKNGDGRFCVPAFNFWGIRAWDTADGYFIRVDEAVDLTLTGTRIPADRPIPLERGWNAIAYYPDRQMNYRDALANLIENDLLILAKDGRGHFCIPEFDFGWGFTIYPNDGIMVLVNADCELIYPAPDNDGRERR